MQRSNRHRTMLILVIMIVIPVPSTWAAQTIVGTWAPDPMDCTPVGGMMSVGPLSLTGDELACTFQAVSRLGDTVTWHGRCSTGDAAPKPATVTAVLHNGTLSIAIAGAPSGSLRRCRAP